MYSLKSQTFPILFSLLNFLCLCFYSLCLIKSCALPFALLILFLFLIIISSWWLQLLFVCRFFPKFLSVASQPPFPNWYATDILKFPYSHQTHLLSETWIIFCFPLWYPHYPSYSCSECSLTFSLFTWHILSIAKPCSASGRLSFTFSPRWLSTGLFLLYTSPCIWPFSSVHGQSVLCIAITVVFQSRSRMVIILFLLNRNPYWYALY